MTSLRLSLGTLAAAALPAIAGAQKTTQPTPRRQAPIEIRGQVPTPQVVTVRPREVPSFERQILVPRFYDHDFWPDIQAPYQVVPQRQLDGSTVSDTLGTGATQAPQVTPTTGATTPGAVTPNAATPNGTLPNGATPNSSTPNSSTPNGSAPNGTAKPTSNSTPQSSSPLPPATKSTPPTTGTAPAPRMTP